MRVLLDECVPEVLRREFTEHQCETARYAGFSGLTNGRLLDAAESAGFIAVVTVDQSIRHQQNMNQRRIALVIIQSDSNAFEDILPHIRHVLDALRTIQPGEVVIIK